MRREGRPHGMVRTYQILPSPLNPRPGSRIVNPVNTPPTAGLFTKVNNKPTNHSKFTGKCEKTRCFGCHLHPSWKSKDKSKGGLKLKNADAELDYRQVTWRVMGPNKLRNDGYSASGILDELNIHYHHHHDYDDEDDGDEYDDDNDEMVGRREFLIETTTSHHDGNNNDDVHVHDDGVDVHDDGVDVMVEKDDDVIIHAGVTDDGDDGYMGFYDVAYVVNHVIDEDDEEGWSIVGGDKI